MSAFLLNLIILMGVLFLNRKKKKQEITKNFPVVQLDVQKYKEVVFKVEKALAPFMVDGSDPNFLKKLKRELSDEVFKVLENEIEIDVIEDTYGRYQARLSIFIKEN